MQLPAAGLRYAEDRGDLAMAVAEGLPEHEDGPLGRRELFQQRQQGQ